MSAFNNNSSNGGPRAGPNSRSNPNSVTPFLGPGQPAKESNSTRAARYEDEKKRIIESCFSKKEPDGLLQESYITHVRITEDAMYPSEPPPPDSAPNNKKNRLILVAVRKSGRVRVHKARENPSGTFSIGKTWNLDELSAIHIYTGVVPTNDKEQAQKQWAGDNGFTVTLVKAYYWHAPTSKEKDFFIASLIKIYKKYTGGKLPELTGFLPHQMDALAGPQQNRVPSTTIPQTPANQPVAPPTNTSQRPQSPMARYSPAPRNRFEQQPTAPKAEPVSAIRDTSAPPTSESTRQPPARADRRIASRVSDGPVNGQAKVDSAPIVPPTPRQQPPTQIPLDVKKSDPSLDATEEQDTLAPALLSNGDALVPVASVASMASQDSGSEYLPSNLSLRQRSLSTVRSNERPPSLPAPDRIPVVTSPPLQPSVQTPLPQPDRLPPPDRKRPFMARPDTNGTKTNGGDSQFVTPATTPSAVGEESLSQPTTSAPPPQLSVHALVSVPPSDQEEKKDAPVSPPRKLDYFNAVTMPHVQERTDEGMATPSSFTKGATTAEPEDFNPWKEEETRSEEHRPGLGPMFKKKMVADTFRKAAFAASAVNAFKPRQGGGAARLKAMQEEGKKGSEPDGITGVVPAPLLRGMSGDSVVSNRPGTPGTPGIPIVKEQVKEQPSAHSLVAPAPRVEIQRTATEDSFISTDTKQSAQSTRDLSPLESSRMDDPLPQPIDEPVRPPTPEKARSRSPQRRKRQRQEADIAKYSSSLGVDIRVFEGRGANFNDLLTEFGWNGRLAPKRRIDDLEAEVRREIGRAQASGWLGHVEQQDTKVQDLARAFDRAIEECEELDGLFTLYSHELDTLATDIEYIEAQSQGLQVQTANQKLLQKELQGLLSTLEISNADLQDLHYSSLDHSEGLSFVERALTTLYRALVTIDPSVRQNRQRREGQGGAERSVGVYADAELGHMRAVKEKKNEYAEQSQAFVTRFCQHMTVYFKRLEQGQDDVSMRSVASDSSLNLASQRSVRQEMWIYNATMLFIREVNSYEWKTLIKSYEMNIQGSYQDRFRQATMASRKEARKQIGDEHEALFTFQEKEQPEASLTTSAARKLTVKRSKPPKPSGVKPSAGPGPRIGDGKPFAWEVFQTAVQQQAKAVAEEQNFVVLFFHLSSQTTADFVEIVSSRPPAQRRLPNLDAKMPFEPDKNISLTLEDTISAIFSFWINDLQSSVDWVLKQDQLQGIGVLYALEHIMSTYGETNQDFVNGTLDKLHSRLKGVFLKFVDEQIKAVEDTKVKLTKRKGIISFMRTFPIFAAAVENMIPAEMVSNESLEIRFILNDSYTKILRAMWECLAFIAKDNGTPVQGRKAVPAGGDPEDKEALNYHVTMIENMNHYLEEVDTHQNLVLQEWRNRAEDDMFTHLGQYTDAIIRRPLGKWLDFVESTEAMMKNQDKLTAISGKASHSRSTCKKLLKTYDASEIRKGVETLKRRIEKHFGDVDDPSHMSKSLIARVYDECNARYAHAHDRMNVIILRVYENNLEIDWKKEDVNAMFRR